LVLFLGFCFYAFWFCGKAFGALRRRASVARGISTRLLLLVTGSRLASGTVRSSEERRIGRRCSVGICAPFLNPFFGLEVHKTRGGGGGGGGGEEEVVVCCGIAPFVFLFFLLTICLD
jgi:hypothetical protein